MDFETPETVTCFEKQQEILLRKLNYRHSSCCIVCKNSVLANNGILTCESLRKGAYTVEVDYNGICDNFKIDS